MSAPGPSRPVSSDWNVGLQWRRTRRGSRLYLARLTVWQLERLSTDRERCCAGWATPHDPSFSVSLTRQPEHDSTRLETDWALKLRGIG